MVTCGDLLKLDVFRSIPLVAGKDGLGNMISWPYAKHTKVIAPWVRGGEFVLVSGYELGVNEDELLELLEEAISNHLSGLLIEGGINFKALSPSIIEKADEAKIPLFFASRVVSFLDITREISSLILESQLADQYASSFMEKLLFTDPLNQKELRGLFESHGVPTECRYKLVLFTVISQDINMEQTETGILFSMLKQLQAMCSQALKKFDCKSLSRLSINSVAYLLYADTQEGLDPMLNTMESIRRHFSGLHETMSVTLALSDTLSAMAKVQEGFHQALFTAALINGGVLSSTSRGFDTLGSYQFLFYVEDKDFLFSFRDQYLKELSAFDTANSSQLVETLQTYLNCGYNMLRTAKSLYIHRNTLQHRLDKIQAITGKDLDDTDVRQDFKNALLILSLYPYHT